MMTRDGISLRPDMKLTEAAKIMLKHNIGAAPVADAGNASETAVAETMVRDVAIFTPDADVESLVNFCAQRRMHRLPVVEGGKVVGMVGRRGGLRETDRLYGEYWGVLPAGDALPGFCETVDDAE